MITELELSTRDRAAVESVETEVSVLRISSQCIAGSFYPMIKFKFSVYVSAEKKISQTLCC